MTRNGQHKATPPAIYVADVANGRFPVSRRTLLRGAGAALALPWLEAMMPQSACAVGSRRRYRQRHACSSGGTLRAQRRPARHVDARG